MGTKVTPGALASQGLLLWGCTMGTMVILGPLASPGMLLRGGGGNQWRGGTMERLVNYGSTKHDANYGSLTARVDSFFIRKKI